MQVEPPKYAFVDKKETEEARVSRIGVASSVRVRPHQQLQANGSGRTEYRLTFNDRQQTTCFLFPATCELKLVFAML